MNPKFRKQPTATAYFSSGLLLLLLVLAVLQPSSGDLLSLHRTHTLEGGEWWRIFTGHLVHLSWPHTLMNGCGLVLITITFAPITTPLSSPSQTAATPHTAHAETPASVTFKQLLLYYLLSALSISLLVLFRNPEIGNYFGLSGILYGLVAFYLTGDLKLNPVFSGFALALLIGKIIWDQIYPEHGQLTADLIGGPVANDAHLYGVITGVIFGLYCIFKKNANT